MSREEGIRLGARLAALAACVRQGSRVADVGTDHGYLICFLAQTRRIPGGVACDIRPGPLAKAQALTESCQLSSRVDVCLCDGLDGVAPAQADDIVIAGMGGDNIVAIIARAKWLRSPGKLLILQPQTKAPHLRRFLWEAGFPLLSERGVCEGTHCYTIITAQFTGQPRQPGAMECMVGLLPQDGGADSAEYLRRTAQQLRTRARGLSHLPETAGEAEAFAALAEQVESRISAEHRGTAEKTGRVSITS